MNNKVIQWNDELTATVLKRYEVSDEEMKQFELTCKKRIVIQLSNGRVIDMANVNNE